MMFPPKPRTKSSYVLLVVLVLFFVGFALGAVRLDFVAMVLCFCCCFLVLSALVDDNIERHS